jgi:alanyl-tRNA synthetase
MTTRRLYYDDSFQDNFTANVLSCQPMADPLAGQESSCWGVLLDQTHLYPTSGGQPNDFGKLGDANVVDVRELENGEILHVVDRLVPTGQIDGCIDWPRRFDHMQQHTGQHLLSAVFAERFGLPTVSFHLGQSVSTIDLRGSQPTPQILEGAARAANAMVFEDREISIRYGTAEQFANMGVRKQVERAGTLRAIEIAGIDFQPCGGTHVRRTGQIGTILLRGCSKIRQDWRVEFLCGHRAEAAARRDSDLIARVSAQLKCATADLDTSVDRLLGEREAAARNLKALLPRLADVEAASRLESLAASSDGARAVVEVLHGVGPEYLQYYATALVRSEKVVALLALAETGALVFAQHPQADRDMNLLLHKVLHEVGGKGGGSRDFARGALSDPAKASGALELAISLFDQNRSANSA